MCYTYNARVIVGMHTQTPGANYFIIAGRQETLRAPNANLCEAIRIVLYTSRSVAFRHCVWIWGLLTAALERRIELLVRRSSSVRQRIIFLDWNERNARR